MAFSPDIKEEARGYARDGLTPQQIVDKLNKKHHGVLTFRWPTVKYWVKDIQADIAPMRVSHNPIVSATQNHTPTSGHLGGPKILHFDIETLPNEGYFFDIYSDRGIALQFVRRAKAICCLAYKWHGDENVRVIVSSEPYSDKNVCEEFRPIYDQADYVVGHYAGGFDVPFLNGRMFANGLQPLADKNILDTAPQPLHLNCGFIVAGYLVAYQR